MIELNCSYEESKKIFDLGYDFSKVCDFAWVTMNTNETPVLVCQNSEIQYLLFAQKICDFQTALIKKQAIEIIPIIPKAALEACLPETLFFGFNEDAYLMHEYCDKEFQYRQPPDYYCNDGKIYYSSESVFKAFMWCHENYPKELKKKFEEVMG